MTVRRKRPELFRPFTVLLYRPLLEYRERHRAGSWHGYRSGYRRRAVVGGWQFQTLGISISIAAIIGAVVVLLVIKLIRKA